MPVVLCFPTMKTVLSRRTALSAGAALGLSSLGCVRKEGGEPAKIPAQTKEIPPQFPFGSHPQSFAPGTIFPSAPQAEKDDAVRAYYKLWKKKHMGEGCNPGEVVVKSATKPSNLTVSEAHGYGMIILAYMAGVDPEAKQKFDGMIRYHRAHGSNLTSGIMAWNQNTGCVDVGGDNGAVDGDMDIAYALLLADRQWGSCGDVNYLELASWVIHAMAKSSIEYHGRYPLLGDWVNPQWTLSHYKGTRVSDFMGSHFVAYQTVMPGALWHGLRENCLWIAEQVQSKHSPSGLLPDFVEGLDQDKPVPARMGYLEGARDGSYAYNACRIPLRMGTDFLITGDERPRRIAQRINAFAKKVSKGDPKNLRGGYHLDGEEMVDYETMAFTGPFAVGAMTDPNGQEWLDALWKHSVERESERYYEDTLRLMSMLVLSGNWWAPEKAKSPCPEAPAP